MGGVSSGLEREREQEGRGRQTKRKLEVGKLHTASKTAKNWIMCRRMLVLPPCFYANTALSKTLEKFQHGRHSKSSIVVARILNGLPGVAKEMLKGYDCS